MVLFDDLLFDVHGDLICTLSFGSWVEFISKKISRTFNFHNLIILHHFVCSIHFPFSSFFYEIFMSFSVFFSFSFLAWRFACKL